MKLFQFLEEQIQNNVIVKAFSLKITNASASINDKTFKSSLSNKDFKNTLMTEFLSKKDEDLNKLNEALIELKFQVNDINYEVQFTSKINGDEISTVLIKLLKNEDEFKEDLKQSIKDSGMLFKSKTIEDLVELIFYIVDKYKEETPEEVEKEETPKEEPKTTEEKPTETEEPKQEEKASEKPEESTKPKESGNELENALSGGTK
jgi:hypothetical protein